MAGIPVEFVLFGLTLMAVALSHAHAMGCALAGLGAIIAWKLSVAGFAAGPGFAGLVAHLAHEWAILANLFLLLTGFAQLARHVEASGLPDAMPRLLPRSQTGAFVLLALVFLLSAVLDNIAAALIGGTIALHVFAGRVHPGYVAAIVAAANAGGAGSVIGDTTTTMLWISGIGALTIVPAFVPALIALLVSAIPAAYQQHALMPVTGRAVPDTRLDGTRLAIAGFVVAVAVAVNGAITLVSPRASDVFPVLGLAVVAALLVTAPLRRPDWGIVARAAKGAIFLLALVLMATLMPVERLPAPSLGSTFGLGVLSAAFDNIPLTALALQQGGYDWALLAYAVGYGGSMLWFGSSAGVAVSGLFPQIRSTGTWLKAAWHVPLAYLAGFGAYVLLREWQSGQ